MCSFHDTSNDVYIIIHADSKMKITGYPNASYRFLHPSHPLNPPNPPQL